MQSFHIRIDHPGDTGQRLDQLLAARVPGFSRSRLQQLIRDGCVTVNKRAVRQKDLTHLGDEIVVNVPEPEPTTLQPEAIPIRILHEDPHFLVLDKDPGLVVHPGAGNRTGTLVHALLHHYPKLSVLGGVERPGIVHRLDRETSGCLVVARDDVSHRRLSTQFAARNVRKIYLAVVTGRPRHTSGRIDAPIARHPVHRQRMAVSAPGRGRAAVTEFQLGPTVHAATLVVCKLLTGRTHQIRVHLAHLGHPILGDAVYGGKPRSGSPAVPRLMLHAWILAFEHPMTGEPMEFRSTIPPAFHPWTSLSPLPEFS